MQHEGLNVAMGTITLNSWLFMHSFFSYYILLEKSVREDDGGKIRGRALVSGTQVWLESGENNKLKMSLLNSKLNYNWQSVSLNQLNGSGDMIPHRCMYVSDFIQLPPNFIELAPECDHFSASWLQ